MLLSLRPARCSFETVCVCVCVSKSGSDTSDQLVCRSDRGYEVTRGGDRGRFAFLKWHCRQPQSRRHLQGDSSSSSLDFSSPRLSSFVLSQELRGGEAGWRSAMATSKSVTVSHKQIYKAYKQIARIQWKRDSGRKTCGLPPSCKKMCNSGCACPHVHYKGAAWGSILVKPVRSYSMSSLFMHWTQPIITFKEYGGYGGANGSKVWKCHRKKNVF